MAAEAKYTIRADDKSREGLSSAKSNLGTFQASMQAAATKMASIGEGMISAGRKMTVGITAPLIAMGVVAVKAADEQAKAMASLAAAIATAGNTASISLANLTAFADEMQKKTLFGDEAQLAAMSMLESLTALDEQGILKLMPHVMDLATRFGMDLDSAAALVGKTLGSTTNALSRYGIEVNTEAPLTSKLAELTAALGGKFAGLAEAAALAGAGPLQVFKNRVSEIGEQFGNVLIPHLIKMADSLSGVLSWFENLSPKMQEFLVIFAGIAAVAGPGLVFLGSLATAAPAIVAAVTAVSGAFGGLATALGGLVGGGAGAATAGLVGGPFGLAIAGFAALAPAAANVAKNIAYWLMDDAMPKLSQFCTNVAQWFANLAKSIVEAIGNMTAAVSDWVGAKLTAALDKVKSWAEAVGGFFKGLYERVVGHSIIPEMVTEVLAWMDTMAEGMISKSQEAVDGSEGAFSGFKPLIGTGQHRGPGGAVNTTSGSGGGLSSVLVSIAQKFLSMIAATDVFTKLMDRVNDFLGPLVNQIAKPLVAALRPLLDIIADLLTAVMPAFVGVFKSLGDFIKATLPLWVVVGKILTATITIVGWLIEKLFALGTTIWYIVSAQWDKIGSVDWGGKLAPTLDEAMANFEAGGGLPAATTAASTSTSPYSGTSPSYNTPRIINVGKGGSIITVNTDVITGEGGVDELVLLLRDKLGRLEALGY